MNSVKLSRSVQITGVSGILLLIGLLAFPWYSVSVFGVTATGTAVQYDGSWAAILGLIVLIALLATIAVQSFTSTELPDLPISWSAAELYAAIAVAVFIAIKFLSHIGNFGWGFYVDVLLTIGLVYGAAQLRRDAPANAATSESGAEPTT
jgi:phosphoglycerol transferase MdoB-like AlkP superfamily enzyme